MNQLDDLRFRLELLLTKATPMSRFDKVVNEPDFGRNFIPSSPAKTRMRKPKESTIPVAEEGEVQPYISNRQKKIASRRLRQNKLDKLFDKLVSQGDNADPRLMAKIQEQLGKMFKVDKTNNTNAPMDEREALARKFCAIRMNVERKKAMQRMGNNPLKMEKLWGGDPSNIPEEGPNQLKQSQMNFFPQHEKAAPIRPQSTKEGQMHTKFEHQVNMKIPKRHSLIKSTFNYGFLLEKAEGPRDYSQPVDSAEAFKYRRNVPSERRANYEVLREQGFSPEEATRLKDWKPGPLRTIIQNKDMPDRGLDPEWIDNPQEKLGKETELMDDYKNAGIRKVPGMEPITPQESQRLNQYYQQAGKPLIHVPTPEEFQSQMAQYKEMKREGKAPPMFNKALAYLFDLDISKAGNAIKELEDFIREYEATIRSSPKDWSPKDIAQHTRMLNQAKQKLEGHYKQKLIGKKPVMPTQPLQTQLPLEY